MLETLADRVAMLKDTLVAKDIVIISDMEGPFLLGDTALEVMSTYVRPREPLSTTIDYGAELYVETYEWFNARFKASGVGQEGSDIALCIAPLLAVGATDENISVIAHSSKHMSGVKKLIEYVNLNNGLLIGVTTAWEKYHASILHDLGFACVFGSAFMLDDIPRTKQLEDELVVTRQYLRDCFSIMDRLTGTARATQLRRRIERFYLTEMGLLFNGETSQSTTVIANLISNFYVVGDIGKYDIARSIQELCGLGTLVITIGDGLNDALMLKYVGLSIGINGPDAVKAAKLGLVTSDISVLIDLIEIAMADSIETASILRNFNEIYPDMIHEGGKNIGEDLLLRHAKMRSGLKKRLDIIP